MHDRSKLAVEQKLSALAEGLLVAAHQRQPFERRPLGRQKLVPDPLKVFSDDMQPRLGQQMMDVCHPPGAGVLDRNHGQRRPGVQDRREGFLEGNARQRLAVRKHRAARQIGIGAGCALKGDRAAGQGFGLLHLTNCPEISTG